MAGAAALTAVVLIAPAAAIAQPSEEIEQRLGEVEAEADALGGRLREQQSRVAEAEEELAAVGVRLEDARGRLRAAEGRLALAEVALADAEEARDEAAAASDAAQIELDRTARELSVEEGALADQAVAAFKFGSVGSRAGGAALDVLRTASDPNDLAVGMHQIGRVIDEQGTTVARVSELRDARAVASDEADRARAAATQAAADAEAQVVFTDGLRADAEELTAEVAAEEEAQRAVTADLRAEAGETEASLQRVAARQEELTAELAQRRAEEEAARQAAAAAEAAAAAAAAAERSPSDGSGAVASGGGGGGGAGGPAMDGVCPVAGAVAGRDFSNDWGDPRSGGRTHQGNDIFAARGTPIVAISDGVVTSVNATESGLGGLTVTYRTADGSEWYNAHLETVAPGMSPGTPVSQGQTVGTVGDSGNARGTPPHNHIGRRHGGGWVNPWPTISPLCR